MKSINTELLRVSAWHIVSTIYTFVTATIILYNMFLHLYVEISTFSFAKNVSPVSEACILEFILVKNKN